MEEEASEASSSAAAALTQRETTSLLVAIYGMLSDEQIQRMWARCPSKHHEGRHFYRHRVTRQVTWDRPAQPVSHLALPPHPRCTQPSDAVLQILHHLQALLAEGAAPYKPNEDFAVLDVLPDIAHSRFLSLLSSQTLTKTRAALVTRVADVQLNELNATAIAGFGSAQSVSTSIQTLGRRSSSFDVIACFGPINLVWANPFDGSLFLGGLAAALRPQGRLLVTHLDDGAMRRGILADGSRPSPCSLLEGDSAWWWWTPSRHAQGGGVPLAFQWQEERQRDTPLAMFACTDTSIWRAAEAAGLRVCMSWDYWTLWQCLRNGKTPSPRMRGLAKEQEKTLRGVHKALTSHDIAVLKALRVTTCVHSEEHRDDGKVSPTTEEARNSGPDGCTS